MAVGGLKVGNDRPPWLCCIITDMTAAARPLTQPHADRLSPDDPHYSEIIRLHSVAMERGEAGYPDPASGAYVMTAATHLTRGRCCTNGCRHCPYV